MIIINIEKKTIGEAMKQPEFLADATVKRLREFLGKLHKPRVEGIEAELNLWADFANEEQTIVQKHINVELHENADGLRHFADYVIDAKEGFFIVCLGKTERTQGIAQYMDKVIDGEEI